MFATTRKGQNDSTLYVIGQLVYIKHTICGNVLKARCRNINKNRCRARASIELETLRVIQLHGIHTCRPRMKKNIQ